MTRSRAKRVPLSRCMASSAINSSPLPSIAAAPLVARTQQHRGERGAVHVDGRDVLGCMHHDRHVLGQRQADKATAFLEQPARIGHRTAMACPSGNGEHVADDPSRLAATFQHDFELRNALGDNQFTVKHVPTDRRDRQQEIVDLLRHATQDTAPVGDVPEHTGNHADPAIGVDLDVRVADQVDRASVARLYAELAVAGAIGEIKSLGNPAIEPKHMQQSLPVGLEHRQQQAA